eukprot:gnl/Spiro4/16186_TR8702_c0_g1_i1.p1 gnl/Spiro4/16186_TR8702_c0_g1~~gnl/Spiro4/16186_TR8702_c0_g1_i1.p1  ORF type:complete len:204 (+),score=62.76 gnl/Spiro4/16186_TR8702_c0_g1_i1:49-612(+)
MSAKHHGKKESKPAPTAAAEEKKQINVYDLATVKKTLDEATSEILANDAHIEEDFTYPNIKLAVGILAIGIALTAQFWPTPFPQIRPFLAVCVASYAVLTMVMNVLIYFEGDVFMSTKAAAKYPPFNISSRMAPYEPVYSLTIASKTGTGTLQKEIRHYFDEDGVFYDRLFAPDVLKTLAEAHPHRR